MDPFFVKGIQLFLSLSILIILHEFGHFIPARLFGIRVEKFYLFFDVKFSLFKKKIGDTVYGIGWLPLGGYVKIAGMIDESMDKEQMAEEPKPWEFRSKPAWQRLIVMLGGVTVNILLGFLIYVLIIAYYGKDVAGPEQLPNGLEIADSFKEYGFKDGDQVLEVNGKDFENSMEINRSLMLRNVQTVTVQHPDGERQTVAIPEDIGSKMFEEGTMAPFSPIIKPVLDSIVPDSPAALGGLKHGDVITALNGTPITSWSEFRKITQDNPDQTDFTVNYTRDGAANQTKITLDEAHHFGVFPEAGFDIKHIDYSLGESVTAGVSHGYWILHDYVAQFKYVFTKKGATQVGGFGAIAGLFPDTWNWLSFWETTALISIILAFMNILPIPALDGGHVMFLLYEIITGRKPSDKFLEYAQMIGFFVLIALVLFANGNDVYRWLFK
ncbi:MAG: RIP metalloprotease RseP [Leeuwenhoekiella sp.]